MVVRQGFHPTSFILGIVGLGSEFSRSASIGRAIVLNIFQRILFASACILLGFLFFPFFFVGGLIAWSIYRDIVEAPARRAEQAEIEARINAPLSAENIRWACESPAETSFLDIMVSAYALQTGPGAVEGRGLRLRNQVSMGRLIINSGYASSQYRADFLIDEKLVVEIDGATYHSSPEAVARDRQRDADMRREGYSVLRIPAQVVFQEPTEVVKRVEDARRAIRRT
jgi:very-short-patch-repair endonuclease